MDNGSGYRIAFKGLKNGIHHFEFTADDSFFKSFEGSSIEKGEVDVKLELEKSDSMMVAHFSGNGSFVAACDRCLSTIDIPLTFSTQVIFQFDENERDEDDIIYFDPKRNFLDVKEVLYELIHVNRPIRNIRDCRSENSKYCDLKALEKLEGRADRLTGEDDIWGELRELKI